jgi:hypothetical protein
VARAARTTTREALLAGHGSHGDLARQGAVAIARASGRVREGECRWREMRLGSPHRCHA